MNRWPQLTTRTALTTLAALVLAGNAWAARNFPAQVERGNITFIGMRDAQLNGQPVRLAPGLVVRNERNVIPLPGSLQGQTYTVNYLRDPMGLIRQVWILTPEEVAKPLPSQSRAARNLQRSGGAQADTADLYRN